MDCININFSSIRAVVNSSYRSSRITQFAKNILYRTSSIVTSRKFLISMSLGALSVGIAFKIILTTRKVFGSTIIEIDPEIESMSIDQISDILKNDSATDEEKLKASNRAFVKRETVKPIVLFKAALVFVKQKDQKKGFLLYKKACEGWPGLAATFKDQIEKAGLNLAICEQIYSEATIEENEEDESSTSGWSYSFLSKLLSQKQLKAIKNVSKVLEKNPRLSSKAIADLLRECGIKCTRKIVGKIETILGELGPLNENVDLENYASQLATKILAMVKVRTPPGTHWVLKNFFLKALKEMTETPHSEQCNRKTSVEEFVSPDLVAANPGEYSPRELLHSGVHFLEQNQVDTALVLLLGGIFRTEIDDHCRGIPDFSEKELSETRRIISDYSKGLFGQELQLFDDKYKEVIGSVTNWDKTTDRNYDRSFVTCNSERENFIIERQYRNYKNETTFDDIEACETDPIYFNRDTREFRATIGALDSFFTREGEENFPDICMLNELTDRKVCFNFILPQGITPKLNAHYKYSTGFKFDEGGEFFIRVMYNPTGTCFDREFKEFHRNFQCTSGNRTRPCKLSKRSDVSTKKIHLFFKKSYKSIFLLTENEPEGMHQVLWNCLSNNGQFFISYAMNCEKSKIDQYTKLLDPVFEKDALTLYY